MRFCWRAPPAPAYTDGRTTRSPCAGTPRRHEREGSMDADAATIRWYRTLSRAQWRVLIASNLGWLFDGFEIYALFLTVFFALHQLLDAGQYAAIPQYAGYIFATTVFGW